MPVCPACKAPLLNPAEPCPYCGAPTTGVAADLGTGAWIPMMQMPELAPASSDASPAFNVQLPIGTPRRVPGRAPAETALTPFEGLVYSLVDDVVGCEDVVAASGLARVDAATALERLAALGLITLGDTLAAPPHTQPDGFGTPRTEDTPKFVKTNSGSGLGVIPLKKMTAAEAAEQIPALIRAAKQAWGEGDLAEARDRLTKAHARDPDHEEVRNLHELLNAPHAAQLRAKALVDLGIKAERRRAMADAVMFYDRALNEFEPSAVLHHRVSLCMLHAGLPPREAVPHAQRALELVPGNPRYRELVDRLNAWKPA